MMKTRVVILIQSKLRLFLVNDTRCCLGSVCMGFYAIHVALTLFDLCVPCVGFAVSFHPFLACFFSSLLPISPGCG